MTVRPGPVLPQRLVVLGASLGGLRLMDAVLPAFSRGPYAVVLVQHRSSDPHGRLAGLLAPRTTLDVLEPDADTELRAGCLYIAPPDYHLLVDACSLELSLDPPVNASRPSIDVTFESASVAWRSRLAAALLTASTTDGVAGLEAVRRRGGEVLVQDPAEAESPVAVREACARLGLVGLPAASLARRLAAWARLPAPSRTG